MRIKYTISALFLLFFVAFRSAHAQTIAQLKADKQYELFNYTEALHRYLRIAEKGYPKSNTSYINFHIGDCYRLTGNPVEAEKWYAKSIGAENIEPKYYLYYALVLKENAKYDEYNRWVAKYNQVAKTEDIRPQMITENDLDEFQRMASRYNIREMPFNSKYSDYSPAFFGDSILFVSSRDSAKAKSGWTGEYYYSIFMSYPDSTGAYSKVRRLPADFGTKYHEGPMSYYAPDSILYFTRNNNKTHKKGENISVKRRNLQILQVQYSNGKWLNFEVLPFNSIAYSCAHPGITDDGKMLYFASDRPGGYGGTDIYKVMKTDSTWGEPVNLGPEINTKGNELFPFINSDGTLFFASDGRQGLGGLDVFYADPTSIGFKNARNIGAPINSSRDDFGLITQGNKQYGYFSSNRNLLSNDDIFYFEFLRLPPVAVPDSFVVMKNSKDNYFDVLKNDSAGDLPDFYLSGFDETTEKGGSLKQAGDKLVYVPAHDYFGPDKANYVICDGGYDPEACDTAPIIIDVLDNIFVFEGNVIRWRNKDTLPDVTVELYEKGSDKILAKTQSNANGDFKLILNKDKEYRLHLSKRDYYPKVVDLSTFNVEGDTLQQTYRLKMLPYALEGIVVQRENKEPVSGVKAVLLDWDNGGIPIDSLLTTSDGTYHFPLIDDHNYRIKVIKDDYLIRSKKITTKYIAPQVIHIKDTISMDSLLIGKTIEIEIYFDLGKDNIRPDAAKTLDEEVVQLMIDNPQIILEFGAHTDSRGSARSNQALSQRRANSAVRYIRNKGIEADRISGKGYGETRLKNECKDGVRCPEWKHQENRRVEIKIVGIREYKQIGYKKNTY